MERPRSLSCFGIKKTSVSHSVVKFISNVKRNDLCLFSYSFNATDDDIRRAYRKIVLKHHPDKRKAQGEEIRQDDDYFTCITKAYETLGKELIFDYHFEWLKNYSYHQGIPSNEGHTILLIQNSTTHCRHQVTLKNDSMRRSMNSLRQMPDGVRGKMFQSLVIITNFGFNKTNICASGVYLPR